MAVSADAKHGFNLALVFDAVLFFVGVGLIVAAVALAWSTATSPASSFTAGTIGGKCSAANSIARVPLHRRHNRG